MISIVHNFLIKRIMALRAPDVVLQIDEKPYIYRWYLWPRNKFLNLYYHLTVMSDSGRDLHNHRAWNISWVLSQGYWEHLERGIRKRRVAGQIIMRRAKTMHRLELLRDEDGHEIPSVSLFMFGPHAGSWGFLTKNGYVDSKEYLKK